MKQGIFFLLRIKLYIFTFIFMRLSILACSSEPSAGQTPLGENKITTNSPLPTKKSLSPDRDCLYTHLQEAIEQNEARKPLYAKASGGLSIAVSDMLINAERGALLISGALLDWPSRYWQMNAVPVGCLDFMPMQNSAPFTENGPIPDSLFVSLDSDEFSRLLSSAMLASMSANSSSVKTLHNEIMKLNTVPEYHCMKRHVLESIARTIYLLPKYESLSVEKGLKSPRILLLSYLQSQVLSLTLSNAIDNKAGPLQQEGLPIICNDVPYIPYGPLSNGQEIFLSP